MVIFSGEEHAPFKHIIGEVLLDKTRHCRTVVNKTDNIHSKFRNFSMELLAGEADYVANVKENGLTYQLNFEKVSILTLFIAENEQLFLLSQSFFVDEFVLLVVQKFIFNVVRYSFTSKFTLPQI